MTDVKKYFNTWREFRAIQEVKKDHKDMINLFNMDDKLFKKKIYKDWKNTVKRHTKTNRELEMELRARQLGF